MQVTSVFEQLLFSTVRLETTYKAGQGRATAFLFGHTAEKGPYVFLVSNKHVVIDAIFGQMFFTMRDGDQPRIGDKTTVGFDDFGSRWFGHPDPDVDLVIMPIA